jgi:SAM-dependent methyltransferase
LTDFYRFKRQSKSSDHRFSIHWKDRLVCLRDKTRTTGFDRHYVFHTAWAARILSEIKPEYHVDISSDLRFVTLVSAFIPIKFYDFRPANLELPDLTSKHANLTNLPFEDISIKSLSSMHVVEHIGFGRYGDPIDPQGDIKAISELKRVLSQGGSLLFVVPIGRPRIQFNAHRIYSYDQIIGYFQGLKLEQFALIPDKPAKGGLIANATKEMADEQSYGCGCFHFKKLDKNAKKNC